VCCAALQQSTALDTPYSPLRISRRVLQPQVLFSLFVVHIKKAMSRGYRSGGYNSNVDESLFGKPARKTMIGRAALPANSVVVSTAQIQGIKDRSILRSQADEMRERSMREAEFEEKQAISRARKERMLKMEAEAKSKVRFAGCRTSCMSL